MRVPPRAQSASIAFNLTPLIDVVFNLIIFFLVTSHFASGSPGDSVQLPAALLAQTDLDARRLTVTVLPDGAYSVDGVPASLEDLDAMIATGVDAADSEFAVRIRGDQDAPYSQIESIMLTAAKYGVTIFGFNVVRK